MHQFDQAMGVAATHQTVAVGAHSQVWFMQDNSNWRR